MVLNKLKELKVVGVDMGLGLVGLVGAGGTTIVGTVCCIYIGSSLNLTELDSIKTTRA